MAINLVSVIYRLTPFVLKSKPRIVYVILPSILIRQFPVLIGFCSTFITSHPLPIKSHPLQFRYNDMSKLFETMFACSYPYSLQLYGTTYAEFV